MIVRLGFKISNNASVPSNKVSPLRLSVAVLLLATASYIVLTQKASAQTTTSTAQAASANPGATGLETVLVTAEKRTTDVQKTPTAVAAISGDALLQQGVNSLFQIDTAVPDMTVTRNVAGLQVNIRGVTAVDANPTSESPNSLYVDGAVIAHPTAYDGLFYDVSRVEVLKGPQGTLYGRNSNGGAVNVITNRPTDKYSVEGSVEAGSYNLINVSGAINIPLTDTFSARAAFMSYGHDGYFKSGLDDANQRGGRLEFLWKPDDRQSLLFTADLEKIGGKGSGVSNVVGYIPPVEPPGTKPPAPLFIPANPRDDTFYEGTDATIFHLNSEQYGLMLQYEYDFDFASWTTQIDHRQFISKPNVPFQAPGWAYVPASFDSYTAESRLTSSNDGPLQWIFGAFAFRDHSSGFLNDYTSKTATAPVLVLGNPFELATSWAVFGETTYTPNWLDERLHLTLGGRYSSDHARADVFTSFLGTSFDVLHPVVNSNAFTDKVTVAYDVMDKTMLYATRATGYEAGGVAYGTTPVYLPEYITDYEIGSKSRFFGDKLQVNLEAYYYKYKNFETAVTTIINGIPDFTVANAGGAIYKGLGGDFVYAPDESNLLKLTVSRLYAKFEQFNLSVAYPGQPNLTNQHIPSVPDWTGSFSYDHIWQILQAGSLDAQATVRFRGNELLAEAYTNTPNALYFNDAPWANLDLSLRYYPNASNWSITGYVRNVTNALHPTGTGYSNTTGMITQSFYPPRTVGMILTASVE